MNTEAVINRKRVGEKLAAEREALDLSQSDLAEKLGFDRVEGRRRVWQFENGVALTLEHIASLSKFYGKPIEFFISE